MSELTQAFETAIENARRRSPDDDVPIALDTGFNVQHRGIVFTEQCFYCSKWVSPSDMRTIGESVKMCLACQHKHVKNMLEFVPPPYCQGCMTTIHALAARGDDRLAVHYKDGIYQVLCMTCDADYVQKRKDLFARTRFGYDQAKL